MPFIPVIDSQTFHVALWHISETDETLATALALNTEIIIGKDSRNRQWMASRLLLKELLGTKAGSLQKTETGKPFLPDTNLELSISHSKDYAAAIISRNGSTGIDIEYLSDRILRIVAKFANEFDLKQVELTDIEGLYLIWNAKEVMFKYYARGAVDFRKHLFVDLTLRKDGLIIVHIEKPDFKAKVHLNFQRIENYLLTYINHLIPIEIYENAVK